jgi:hypothetical protein
MSAFWIFNKIKFGLFNVVKEGQFDVPMFGNLWYTTRKNLPI